LHNWKQVFSVNWISILENKNYLLNAW
jgi:hypothetical protein